MPSQAENLDFPGVAPSRQKRRREMTAALLGAGAEMLRSRSLAELSIETLCAEVDATVGAFYSRFESKEAYFNALMALAARDGEQRLGEIRRPSTETSVEKLCHIVVSGVVAWMRSHE